MITKIIVIIVSTRTITININENLFSLQMGKKILDLIVFRTFNVVVFKFGSKYHVIR